MNNTAAEHLELEAADSAAFHAEALKAAIRKGDNVRMPLPGYRTQQYPISDHVSELANEAGRELWLKALHLAAAGKYDSASAVLLRYIDCIATIYGDEMAGTE